MSFPINKNFEFCFAFPPSPKKNTNKLSSEKWIFGNLRKWLFFLEGREGQIAGPESAAARKKTSSCYLKGNCPLFFVINFHQPYYRGRRRRRRRRREEGGGRK